MKSCLIVDDSRVIRKVARNIMEDLGFEAEEAENGQVALEACQKRQYDAILLDWYMPVMNGIDFLRAMRAEGVYAAGPSGSVVLPVDERIESKRTIHVDWPSFSSPQGKAIRYGSQCCPRTIDIIDRYTGVIMDPTFGDEEVNDIVRAIRKVYTAMNFA